MLRRERTRRTLLRLLIVSGMTLGASYAGGCNTASFSPEVACTGNLCSCEQDPAQPLCKGFNEREDASLTEPFDAAPQDASEAGPQDAGDAGDAEPDDGGDEAG